MLLIGGLSSSPIEASGSLFVGQRVIIGILWGIVEDEFEEFGSFEATKSSGLIRQNVLQEVVDVTHGDAWRWKIKWANETGKWGNDGRMKWERTQL